MLGDGNLTTRRPTSNAWFRITRKAADRDYLIWTMEHFSEFLTPRGIMDFEQKDSSGNLHEAIGFYTKASPAFTEFHRKWYPGGKKTIPEDLVLTPLSIAIWFADDGTVKRRSRNGFQAAFYTYDFTKDETTRLRNLLAEICEDQSIVVLPLAADNLQHYILFPNTEACKRLFRIIDGVMPLQRKAEIWRRDFDIWTPSTSFPPSINCTRCGSENTKKRGLSPSGQQRYACKDCGRSYMALEDYCSLIFPQGI
jgi:DNA-directed RNA polymerase subunit RPC12/RpoP